MTKQEYCDDCDYKIEECICHKDDPDLAYKLAKEEQLNLQEDKQMANKTLRDEAEAYQPTKITKNIAELPQVSTDVLTEEETFKGTDGEPVTIKVIEVNGERYRVPASVLKDLKVVLEDNPNLKSFKVKKVGEGMNTRYTLIPLS